MRSYHPHMDTKLLELLVCPVTKGPLRFNQTRDELISRSARLAYPIRDGIPILLEQEARPLTDAELEAMHASITPASSAGDPIQSTFATPAFPENKPMASGAEPPSAATP